MRKSFFLTVFVLVVFHSQAQFALIPDTNFRNFLMNNGFAGCMQGDSLDTTCTAVTGATSIGCVSENIYDLTGIEYFDSLLNLYCYGNHLTQLGMLPFNLCTLNCRSNAINSIGFLPPALQVLDCSYNQLTSIPAFPNTLKSINCNHNQVAAFTSLPDSLIHLYCNANNLSSLPAFPGLLKVVDCSSNHISLVPAMPDSMISLLGSQNQFTSITNLSANLVSLDCQYNQLTTLPALPSTLALFLCNDNQLTSLPALPPLLQSLVCWDNQLTSLPALPGSLGAVYCHNNQITSLPTLPNSIIYLTCSNNLISSLPVLPASIQALTCDNNPITSLPALPAGLLQLSCMTNQLTTLPVLPNGMLELSCDGNQLTSLPTLPDSLKSLYCNNNMLTTIPTLPALLEDLGCSYNLLSTIPALPPLLESLGCSGNQVSSLPTLPPTINNLYCAYNPITSLPVLPDTLFYLDISHTQISCLSELKTITTLQWDSTLITCFPNYGNIFQAYPLLSSVSLCQPSSGCPTYWNISGTAFSDSSGNCVIDSNDYRLRNIPVVLDSGGVQLQMFLTNDAGNYSFRTGLGNYSLRIDTTSLPLIVNCPVAFFNPSSLTVADSLDSLVNFGLQCPGGFDLISKSISPAYPFRPGQTRELFLHAGDAAGFYGGHCAVGVSGTVQAIIGNLFSYTSPAFNALTPNSVNGDTITWNISDFSLADPERDFNIIGQVSNFATINDSICIRLTVLPGVDNNLLNNSLNICIPVSASFDPNEKYMSPSGLVDTSQQWFTFTIFFQNVGNAPAENIYILDTLDQNLDATTFTYLSSSHEAITQLLPSNILRFNYPGINLIDSTTNELGSHGYVQYKVRKKNNLPVNSTISNTAYIYFDFNAPVVTNTVSATFILEVGVDKTEASQFIIYPNPAVEKLTIDNRQNTIGLIKIYNLLGEELMTIQRSGAKNNHMVLDIHDLNSGIYFLRIEDENGFVVKRFVKSTCR